MKRNGPPRKPTRLKLIEGTYRQDRAAPNEPRPAHAMPTMPVHLSPAAQEEWARMSAMLSRLGLLTEIDGTALALYCEAYSDWVDASRLCASKDGQDRKVIKTVSGNFIENPYFSVKKKLMVMMHHFLIEFGMTPASRTRINAEPPADGATGGGSRWAGFA